MYWWDRVEELIELAFISEADDYEIDQAGIYFDPATKRYALLTASGCSCWDGEFDEEQFDTLDDLEASLADEDRTYNPTLKGAQQLVLDARASETKREKETE